MGHVTLLTTRSLLEAGKAPIDANGYSGTESEDDESQATLVIAEGFSKSFIVHWNKQSGTGSLLSQLNQPNPPKPMLIDPDKYEQWKSTYVPNEKHLWLPLPRAIRLPNGRLKRTDFNPN